jgi:hypothetical protein
LEKTLRRQVRGYDTMLNSYSSYYNYTPRVEHRLIAALRHIKRGCLYLVIGSLLIGGIGLTLIPYASSFSNIYFHRHHPLTGIIDIGTFIILIIFALLGAFLSLYGLYGKIVPGTSMLANVRPKYGTASALVKIGYVGGLIILILGLILALVTASMGFIGLVASLVIILLGIILLFIGKIGIIILSFKLNDDFAETLILVAGILFILGIFFPILDFIAWILLYAGLGNVIERLRVTLAHRERFLRESGGEIL